MGAAIELGCLMIPCIFLVQFMPENNPYHTCIDKININSPVLDYSYGIVIGQIQNYGISNALFSRIKWFLYVSLFKTETSYDMRKKNGMKTVSEVFHSCKNLTQRYIWRD